METAKEFLSGEGIDVRERRGFRGSSYFTFEGYCRATNTLKDWQVTNTLAATRILHILSWESRQIEIYYSVIFNFSKIFSHVSPTMLSKSFVSRNLSRPNRSKNCTNVRVNIINL